ncbi:glycosyltransferase [Nitrospira moscoviensis]|uniref:Putative Lipopolysaccharide core biosynthesis glycosyltransferase n=1 Tax=Nitrospira moscoviensis TaxID=42253 RepID=A0A0K2GIK3_NITMO|nr:glycosyltransferase [Nitrospira moscoviensis]ALA60771.1 putative Lipopolysaccharide core biosynthesis glycosyltransferase [Nitrospira moscoviensis]
MKILFLIRSLESGGAERQLVVLARGLRQRGHDVAVAVFYPGGPLEDELKEDDVPIHSLEKRGRWDVLGFLTRLIQTVRRERPDVLHSYISNLVTVPVQPFCPGTRIVWGVRSSHLDFDRYDWLFRFSHKLSCRLARSADLIIANSHAGRRGHVADGYPAQKTAVIPNGIDTARFRRNPAARERIRREWGISRDEELIGLVGRLDPMKDHETFLRAAAQLSHVRPAVRFVCVGDGPSAYRAALQGRTGALGLSDRLLWAGMRSDMANVYSALDLLVNCSYGEGFSNVIGEAMACGVPCVATDVGDSRLIVGSMGALVPPKDPMALMKGMQQVLDRRLPPAEIRRPVVERFSVETLVRATEQHLLALCHGTAIESVEPRQRTLAS